MQRSGLTLPELAQLAGCHGAHSEVYHAETASAGAFREAVHQAACAPGEPHLVVSYDRRVLGQTGAGHFSPVGGYHGGRDLVLILDVARFKYPPHWVPLMVLFQAMLSTDPVTGRSRGYAQLWRDSGAPRQPAQGLAAQSVGCASVGAPCAPTSDAGHRGSC